MKQNYQEDENNLDEKNNLSDSEEKVKDKPIKPKIFCFVLPTNWRMRYLILLVIMIFVFGSFSIFTIVIQVKQKYTSHYLFESSIHINDIELENQKQFISSTFNSAMSKTLFQGKFMLFQIRNLYNQLYKLYQNKSFTSKINNPIHQNKTFSQFIRRYCQFNFNSEDLSSYSKNESYYQLIMQHIGERLPDIIQSEKIIFASHIYIFFENIDQTSLQYPCKNFQDGSLKNYTPRTTQTYLNQKKFHEENKNSSLINGLVVSGPFSCSIFYKLLSLALQNKSRQIFTVGTSLFDDDRQFKGVVAMELDFTQFQQQLGNKYKLASFFLVNNQGVIFKAITNMISFPNELIYIYNSSFTGFNKEDWIQIQNFVMLKPYLNNCTFVVTKNSLCRFNSLLNREILIDPNLFEDYHFISIMQQQFSDIFLQNCKLILNN